MTLGQKIKKYREEAGISQMDLELEIGTSHGRISKIENDKINPDKETIAEIAKALELETPQVASLFGIEVPNYNNLIPEINKILLCQTKEEVISEVVNNLIFKMGYIASALFLIDGDHVYMPGLTLTNISEKAVKLLDEPLNELRLNLKKETDNLTLKVIKEGKSYLTHYTRKYIVPMVDRKTADAIQKVTGDKSTIIYPLKVDDNTFGAIAYVKKVKSDFKGERKTLKLVTDQIAIALHNIGKDRDN